MKTITFHKKVQTALCLFCKVNRVPLKDWNKRCSECKEKQSAIDREEQRVNVGARQPAAIIEIEGGQKVFVDKFGNEVPNPGYDLVNDPRGYNYTGKAQPKRTFIK